MWRQVLVLVFALASIGWSVPAASAAARLAPAGSIGHDISFPQRDGPYPDGGAFGIVGVNGGLVFTPNPFLAQQYAWADALPDDAMLYVNTGNPGPDLSKTLWPDTGEVAGGATCRDGESDTDPGCAYVYGYQGAANSVATARDAGVPISGTWWLDVERGNSWLPDTDRAAATRADHVANAANLQGAYESLLAAGIEQVGIYSTNLQWTQITGGYTAATAADYRAAWADHFAPQRAMETAPLWIAGVTAEAAQRNCGTGITGGPTVLAQYIATIGDRNFDHNLVCGPARAVSTASACAGGAPPAGYVPFYGTGEDDKLRGSGRDEIFFGGGGDDEIRGGGGDDVLCGGPGNDKLRGGAGSDRLEGEDGRDNLKGSGGGDVLQGGAGKDELAGGNGRDDLRGGGGADELAGGSGRDRLKGQGGSDTLDGGPAKDRCSPGPGRDPAPRSC